MKTQSVSVEATGSLLTMSMRHELRTNIAVTGRREKIAIETPKARNGDVEGFLPLILVFPNTRSFGFGVLVSKVCNTYFFSDVMFK